jgi:antitoxin component YwqK of YwqJK toxin-antitoxin module
MEEVWYDAERRKTCINEKIVKTKIHDPLPTEEPQLKVVENKNKAGQLCERYTVNAKNGQFHGKYKSWYSNGQHKWIETEYKKDQRHGQYTVWWNNGQKYIETKYMNGKVHGKLTGWYDNGQLALEEWYDHGQLIEKIKYPFKSNEQRLYDALIDTIADAIPDYVANKTVFGSLYDDIVSKATATILKRHGATKPTQ